MLFYIIILSSYFTLTPDVSKNINAADGNMSVMNRAMTFQPNYFQTTLSNTCNLSLHIFHKIQNKCDF